MDSFYAISNEDVSFKEKELIIKDLLQIYDQNTIVEIRGNYGTLLDILEFEDFLTRLKFHFYGKKNEFKITKQSDKLLSLQYISVEISDLDSDGVPDDEDFCPEVKGSFRTNGCPDDDSDGFANSEDDCPNDGVASRIPRINGCPDTDGDGVPNHEDECPDIPGDSILNGCPLEVSDVSGGGGNLSKLADLKRTELDKLNTIFESPGNKTSISRKIFEIELLMEDYASQTTNQSTFDSLFMIAAEKIIFLKQESGQRDLVTRFNDNYEMIRVTGGGFNLGCGTYTELCDRDNSPPKFVQINTFYMDAHEITYRQYLKFLNEYNSDKVKYGLFKGQPLFNSEWIVKEGRRWVSNQPLNQPITGITWYGANEYAEYYNLSLPTEAEWEFAARGGRNELTNDLFAGTNAPDSLSNFAVFESEEPQRVGIKSPNKLGIYDLSGNVAEWCYDYYDKNTYRTLFSDINPSGPIKGNRKVVRGGSFDSSLEDTFLFKRDSAKPKNGSKRIGFRCVKKIPQN